MRTIVGLGNPGRVYAGSRHNVGFAVIEELARRWQWRVGPVRHGTRSAHGVIAEQPTRLVEPQIYMNLSGDALAELDPPADVGDLIVVHDDLDLEPGCVRLKRGGGTAGHHGLDSVVARFGPTFTRVRVGVGHPEPGHDTAAYVLSPLFDNPDRDMVGAAVQRAADAVEYLLVNGVEAAMNVFNVRTKGAKASAAVPMGRD